MTFLKRAILVPLCFSFFTPKAYGDSLDLDKPPASSSSNTTKANLKKKKNSDVPEFELVVPAFVIHGTQPDTNAANNMPRKLVGSGDAVVTPGIGLEYKSAGGFMALMAGIKDCYNDLAGTIELGEYWRISKNQMWGLTAGVYARETPIVCSGQGNCYDLDSYNLKFTTFVNGESVDIIPMPFIHYTYVLYRDKDLQINFKFMGNIALNEFGIDIPF